jgi:hypothetical protein
LNFRGNSKDISKYIDGIKKIPGIDNVVAIYVGFKGKEVLVGICR